MPSCFEGRLRHHLSMTALIASTVLPRKPGRAGGRMRPLPRIRPSLFDALPASGLLERSLFVLPPAGLLEDFLFALSRSALLERFWICAIGLWAYLSAFGFALSAFGLLERDLVASPRFAHLEGRAP
jgi:hypothetical protein